MAKMAAGLPYSSNPKFEHDCAQCKFLGHYYMHDMYYCQRRSPRLLFRSGDESHEYETWPYLVHRTVLMAMPPSDDGDRTEMLVIQKRITLGRLLADAHGLKDAKLLGGVTVEGLAGDKKVG